MRLTGVFSHPPREFRVITPDVRSGKFIRCEKSDLPSLDRDPRGVLWMWEPPRPGQEYVMGIDPTVGIPGWDRSMRLEDDESVDNAAIQIIRVGASGKPDVQVAEYAAPIDPYDLADVANMCGRMYGGSDEDGQALCIIEVFPGPGLSTQRKLLEVYGYTRHFVWKHLDRAQLHYTTGLGWYSTAKSVRDLWILGTRHVEKDLIEINSPWLAEEMADCENDPVKMRGKAVYGRHDDRVSAMLMALWAAHDWTGQVDVVQTQEVSTVKQPDWQRSDVTAEKMWEQWDEQVESWLDED